MMNLIPVINEDSNGILTVSSRTIAEQLGKRHEQVLRSLDEKSQNTKVCFDIIESSYQAGTGKKYKEYLLTKRGFLLYMFSINGHDDFKLAYIDEFDAMESFIKERFSTEWLETRVNGKLIRRTETDTILYDLIPYAKEKGSSHPDKYFIHYSNLVNSTTGIDKGMRDKITKETLSYLATLENMISKTILEEIDNDTNYKDIYTICKHKCELFKEISTPPKVKFLDTLYLKD